MKEKQIFAKEICQGSPAVGAHAVGAMENCISWLGATHGVGGKPWEPRKPHEAAGGHWKPCRCYTGWQQASSATGSHRHTCSAREELGVVVFLPNTGG